MVSRIETKVGIRDEVLSGLEAGDRVLLEPGQVEDGQPVVAPAGGNDRPAESGS